jgi:hypothetical protein
MHLASLGMSEEPSDVGDLGAFGNHALPQLLVVRDDRLLILVIAAGEVDLLGTAAESQNPGEHTCGV